MAQQIKNLSAMQEMQVQSMGWEDLLEEDMATYSSILVWKIPWKEEPGGLQSLRIEQDLVTKQKQTKNLLCDMGSKCSNRRHKKANDFSDFTET